MANRKKISELELSNTISGDDLFVVVDPNTQSGNDASASGKTNKVTLDTIKNSMFPAGAPIQFWNENSNNIFFNTGNVGIGTESPARKLDVQGVQGWKDSDGVEKAGLNPARDGTDFQLFDSNGISSIRFDSRAGGNSYINNGNVGIGTDSPIKPLEIRYYDDVQYEGGVTGNSLRLRNMEEDTTSTHCGIDLFAGVSTVSGHNPLSRIYAVRENDTDGKCALTFATRTTSNVLEHMRIDSDGNVGIGTASPDAKLHIKSDALGTTAEDEQKLATFQTITANDSRLEITARRKDDGTNWYSSSMRIQRKVDSTIGAFIEFDQVDNTKECINFGEGYTNYMTIRGDGNVGIGTDSPDRNLTVAGNFRLEKRDVDGGHTTLDFNSGGGADEPELNIYDKDGNPGVFTLKDGNVGIGTTTTDGGRLTIKAPNASNAISVYNEVDNDRKMVVHHYDNGGVISMYNDGVPMISIDGRLGTPNNTYFNAGNVGIGTATPTSGKLVVSGQGGLHIANVPADTNAFSIERAEDAGINLLRIFQDSNWGDKDGDSQGSGIAHINSNNRTLAITTSDDQSLTQGIIINESGYVGIGTMDPDHKLEVKTPGGKYAVSVVDDTTSEQHLGGLFVNNHGATTDGLDLYLKQPGGSTKVAILSNGTSYFTGGNVGIGNKLPGTYKLNVSGNVFALGNIVAEGSITTQDFQVNGDFAYSGTMYNIGTDVSDVDNVHETNMRGIETLNKIHVCDYTINGKTIVGCVSQDIKNALPSAVSEIKKEVEVCPSKGNIIHGDGDSKLIVRANVTKNDFEKQSWPESYQFEQTHDAETEDVTKLAVSQDQLIATLIKSVQELNAKVNQLSAEVRKNK